MRAEEWNPASTASDDAATSKPQQRHLTESGRAQDERSRRKMSRAEAGRKGGLKTKERHGDDYFGRIGRLGGKKGGESTKQKYGVEFYRNIGRKGGSR